MGKTRKNSLMARFAIAKVWHDLMFSGALFQALIPSLMNVFWVVFEKFKWGSFL